MMGYAVLEATVMARLPHGHRRQNGSWARLQPGGASSTTLLEGPALDDRGRLHCVDACSGRIYRVQDGRFDTLYEDDGCPLGLAFDSAGTLWVTDFKYGLRTIDPMNGTAIDHVDSAEGRALHGANDLVIAQDGTVYFTDQGLTGWQDPTGRLFRYRPDTRELACLLDTVPSPNGLALSGDERQLYLAVTRGNAIWRVPFDRTGNPVKVGTYVQMSGGAGPDGMALDASGGLAVAHVGLGCVWVFDAFGEPTHRVNVTAGRHVTNLAYGGTDGRTLFITEATSGTISTIELPIPGAPWR